MACQDFEPLFAGSEDESLLFDLYLGIENPRNDPQRTFHDAWEAWELMSSDGFEMLLEQQTPLETYAAAFGNIGMSEVQPIFSRVSALIPPGLRQAENKDALCEYLRTLFDELRQLAYEFYDATTEFVPIAARYLRQHQNDFAEYRQSAP